MQSSNLSHSLSPKQDDHWTHYQKRRFKRAISDLPTDTPHFYEKVASRVPGKDLEQVKKYFETYYRLEGNVHVLVSDFENDHLLPPTVATKEITNIRNKPPPIWTRNEHQNFLLGMKKFGMGKWKEIADHCIPSKTRAQISAHALDFFSKKNADTISAGATSVTKKISEASSKKKMVVNGDHKDDDVKNADTITAGVTSVTKKISEASSLKKMVVDGDHKDEDVIVLYSKPADFPPRKVQRTLNLFPLVPGDHASSSGKQEAEERGEDCTLNLFPTHGPLFT